MVHLITLRATSGRTTELEKGSMVAPDRRVWRGRWGRTPGSLRLPVVRNVHLHKLPVLKIIQASTSLVLLAPSQLHPLSSLSSRIYPTNSSLFFKALTLLYKFSGYNVNPAKLRTDNNNNNDNNMCIWMGLKLALLISSHHISAIFNNVNVCTHFGFGESK